MEGEEDECSPDYGCGGDSGEVAEVTVMDGEESDYGGGPGEADDGG